MLPFSPSGRNLEVIGYEQLHAPANLSVLRFTL